MKSDSHRPWNDCKEASSWVVSPDCEVLQSGAERGGGRGRRPHGVRGVAPASVGGREGTTPCEQALRDWSARPGSLAMTRNAMETHKLEARPFLAAPAAFGAAGRDSLLPRGLEGPRGGVRVAPGLEGGRTFWARRKITGMDLEGYARSDLSKKLTSCQRSLKNLFKRSLSLTPPSHRPGVARQPPSTDPALSSVLGARAPPPLR